MGVDHIVSLSPRWTKRYSCMRLVFFLEAWIWMIHCLATTINVFWIQMMDYCVKCWSIGMPLGCFMKNWMSILVVHYIKKEKRFECSHGAIQMRLRRMTEREKIGHAEGAIPLRLWQVTKKKKFWVRPAGARLKCAVRKECKLIRMHALGAIQIRPRRMWCNFSLIGSF